MAQTWCGADRPSVIGSLVHYNLGDYERGWIGVPDLLLLNSGWKSPSPFQRFLSSVFCPCSICSQIFQTTLTPAFIYCCALFYKLAKAGDIIVQAFLYPDQHLSFILFPFTENVCFIVFPLTVKSSFWAVLAGICVQSAFGFTNCALEVLCWFC